MPFYLMGHFTPISSDLQKSYSCGFWKFFALIARQSVHDDFERRPG